ncbi:aminotransferase class I/II-fold pyridoxal phosphate-dependent enzyme [Echinicola marina]|uniref:aminotransferase class I/II-fold pyridoxal phosphate-dependent enzyme n=1 Tax=Echinicola marina TaxID=2859768 RepID=UPI001CF64D8D|nr:aminotransferase class I/II-fold pyridoxal phosphate-dependent enzyme [Echinicola marina]UCS94628.1 aminotransferase class I/II-fold pyridoxal phosphate-dependent enzyme [Echinicola marina]
MQHHSISHKIGRTIPWQGKDYLYFSGTAYLGMGSVPEFEEMIMAGLVQYGPNHGASRFSNVQLQVYEELEEYFAAESGAPYAALLSSGFMAGYICHSILGEICDELWPAPDAHPAILPNNLDVDINCAFGDFAQNCIKKSHTCEGKTIGILCNAVDTIKPAIHDFQWVERLSSANDYYLLIDDSHAFGIFGKGIFGTYAVWKELPVKLIVTGSLGKALATPAGVILGEAAFVAKVKNSTIFRGASPAAPGNCQAFLRADRLFFRQQQSLRENMSYVFDKIKDLQGLRFEQDFPVITFENTGFAGPLLEAGVLISSFSYPRPEDPPVDRIILSAYHRREDLDFLVDQLCQLLR